MTAASCGHPRNDDGECDCSAWPERAPLAEAAEREEDFAPCACWSCDRECGGSVDPLGSCGPLAKRDGVALCQTCRVQTVVFDTERHGVNVQTGAGEDLVIVDPNVYGYPRNKLRLTVPAARRLAAELTAAADYVEAGR